MNSSAYHRPFLTRFASQRVAGEQIEGSYSHETAMWMIETANGSRPAIEYSGSALEMTTKTFARPESDDAIGLELATKTDVQTERDDEDPPESFWL